MPLETANDAPATTRRTVLEALCIRKRERFRAQGDDAIPLLRSQACALEWLTCVVPLAELNGRGGAGWQGSKGGMWSST